VRIALVTAREAVGHDHDMEPLLAALKAEGAEADAPIWDDTSIGWSRYDLAVLRSTWDYSRRRDEFLAWADQVEKKVRLANTAKIVRWNTDKNYLRGLAAAGVPIVPTHFIDPEDSIRLPYPGEIVVKPAVGAGSMDVGRFDGPGPAAEEHVRRLQQARRRVLVQPYLRDVDQAGETALVFFGGVYSHAIRKGAMLGASKEVVGGLYLKEDIQPREATPEERRVGEQALKAAPGPFLYARVDVIPGPGGPVVLEFEATEPSLFFDYSAGSATRYAKTALSWVRSS
jgi:glutathione synthase/RimK-type ligase-like ATP-grasp enzyme